LKSRQGAKSMNIAFPSVKAPWQEACETGGRALGPRP
jgi:hypothetical protein